MSYNLYSLSPITVNSTVLPVENISMSHAVLAVVHQHSGNEYPTLIAIPGANPTLSFRTPFAGAWGLIGGTLLSATTFDVYLAKFVSSIRSGSSVHPKLPLAASATAVCYITGTSVNQDGILMADVQVIYLSSDGDTHPIGAVTTNNALPALASQPVLHTQGPISLGGTVYGGLKSTGIEFGQQIEPRRSDGNPYPRVCIRSGGQPKITGSHEDPIALRAILTQVGTSSAVVQYFRSFDATTGVVALSNSVSISLAAPDRIHPVEMAASQGQPATLGFEAWGLSSTATHPFTVSVAATTPAVP